MKIFVKAKINTRKEGIEKLSDNTFIVQVKELPIDGGANSAIIKLPAEYFKIAKARIKIIGGETNKQKIIEID